MKKTIRVLFAPYNTANMPDITLQALNRVEGIEASGISYGTSKYWNFGPGWTIFEVPSLRRNPVGRIITSIRFSISLFRKIAASDILMWHWDMTWFTAVYIRLLGKKIFVEWLGSDIRVPEFLFKHNPYYKMAREKGEWNYTAESSARSKGIQKKFAFAKAQPILCPEISLFLDPEYFKSSILYYQRLDLHNYIPVYPSLHTARPVLVHTPSATGAKGTSYVRAAIEALRIKGVDFEYVEIHNQTRQEALDAIARCDVFIDQFIVGSYGLATCEAMAMGKPVLCYLMPVVKELLPADCAIIDTSIETLEATLLNLIQQPQKRYDAGVAGRRFVEKYHDADTIALQLKDLFTQALSTH